MLNFFFSLIVTTWNKKKLLKKITLFLATAAHFLCDQVLPRQKYKGLIDMLLHNYLSINGRHLRRFLCHLEKFLSIYRYIFPTIPSVTEEEAKKSISGE